MKMLEELGASPAPWEQDEESALPEVICHLQSGIRYQVAVPYIHSDEETDANTRLICAAPDMYVALRELINAVLNGDPCYDAIQRGKAALAKASGEGEVAP